MRGVLVLYRSNHAAAQGGTMADEELLEVLLACMPDRYRSSSDEEKEDSEYANDEDAEDEDAEDAEGGRVEEVAEDDSSFTPPPPPLGQSIDPSLI